MIEFFASPAFLTLIGFLSLFMGTVAVIVGKRVRQVKPVDETAANLTSAASNFSKLLMADNVDLREQVTTLQGKTAELESEIDDLKSELATCLEKHAEEAQARLALEDRMARLEGGA
jgi:uncharacterized protein YlxW (UPF0749 family)